MLIPGTKVEFRVLDEIPAAAGVPAEFQGRKADAIKVPLGYMGIVRESALSFVMQNRFAAVMNLGPEGRIYTREASQGQIFVTGDPRDTMFTRKDSPIRPGQPRYRWFRDTSDGIGVDYGFLIDE